MDVLFKPSSFYPALKNNYAMVRGSVNIQGDISDKEKYYSKYYRETFLRNHRVERSLLDDE